MTDRKFNMIHQIKEFNESILSRTAQMNNTNKAEKVETTDSCCVTINNNNSYYSVMNEKNDDKYLKPYEWSKILEKSKGGEEKYFIKMIAEIVDNDEIKKLKKILDNFNLTGPDCDDKILCNNIGPLNKYEDDNSIRTGIISSKGDLEEESSNNNSNINNINNNDINKNININNSDNILMWRKMKGDGNCYYRSIMFALMESIIFLN